MVVELLISYAFATAGEDQAFSCKTKSDCVVVDAGCGKPAAVNRAHRNYSEVASCDAAMDYAEQANHYIVDCKAGQCVLLPKP